MGENARGPCCVLRRCLYLNGCPTPASSLGIGAQADEDGQTSVQPNHPNTIALTMVWNCEGLQEIRDSVMCHLYYLRVFEQAGQHRLALLSVFVILKVYAHPTALLFKFASIFLIPKARKNSQMQRNLIQLSTARTWKCEFCRLASSKRRVTHCCSARQLQP